MRVKLFARFRDILGEYVEIEDVRTVKDLKSYLRALLAQQGLDNIPILVAVNGSYVDDSYEIKPDDEIVAFPPVSGG
ncbi:MAG: MoaD/ThiS family protein [Dictyoglomi bacterium]|nr:MoaD/ThiS family protein [Dictyoglomota bacterium]